MQAFGDDAQLGMQSSSRHALPESSIRAGEQDRESVGDERGTSGIGTNATAKNGESSSDRRRSIGQKRRDEKENCVKFGILGGLQIGEGVLQVPACEPREPFEVSQIFLE